MFINKVNKEIIHIKSREYWYKVVNMLQQNWAIIEVHNSGCTVYFISDNSIVFDQISFKSLSTAASALRKNKFSQYEDEAGLQEYISPPEPPFYKGNHPNGPIYSSGRFWN